MSTLFSGHYLRNRSTLDVGVLGYIGIVQHKEQSPEVLSLPRGTPCIVLVVNYFKMLSDVQLVRLPRCCLLIKITVGNSKNRNTKNPNIFLIKRHIGA